MKRLRKTTFLSLILVLIILSFSTVYAQGEFVIENNSLVLYNQSSKQIEAFAINYLFRHSVEATNKINNLLSKGYTSVFYQLDGAQNTWANVFNPSQTEEVVKNTILQATEINYTDKDGNTQPVSSEPSVTTTFTLDALLGNGFNLGTITANIKGVDGAAKYAVKYSVSNDTETKYVTTSKVNNGQATTDLVQHIKDQTNIDILVYDSNDSQIRIFEGVTVTVK